MIIMSPNRKHLRFSVKKTKKEFIYDHLKWLIKDIQERGEMTDKTIIFCNLVSDIACVMNHLMLKLGQSAYSPIGSQNPKDCLLGIYHSSSWQRSKDRVMESFKGQGKIRVVVASAALSMGVNFPDIRYVVNWGPPRSLLDFHQEAGRAGRDNVASHIFIIYHGQQLSQCEEAIKQFVRSEHNSCLRVAAYAALDKTIQPLQPGHMCCSFCTQHCKCKGESKCEICPSFEIEDDDTTHQGPNHMLSRQVTQCDKDDLREALLEIQAGMAAPSIFGSVSMHGFSIQLIDDVVKNCSVIFSVQDIYFSVLTSV